MAITLPRKRLRWSNQNPVDPWLLGAVLILMAFGVVMVYSASVHTATYKKGNGSFYLIRDLVWMSLSY